MNVRITLFRPLLLLPFLILLSISFIYAQQSAGNKSKAKSNEGVRSCTHKLIDQPEGGYTVVGKAAPYKPVERDERSAYLRKTAGDWYLVEQVDIDNYVEADKNFTVYFNNVDNSLEVIEPDYNYVLTQAASDALEKAPQWLRNDLILIFSNISESYQNLWANGILDAEDPYVDEIAFCVAHSSPQYLMSDYGSPGLFLENAQFIYSNDQYLDYVEVVDYGTTSSDENYYSTTRYWTERDGITSQYEVSKDIYYWYLVHPKITDDIPAYIDPDITEDNSSHNNNIAPPPDGVFWRDFLINSADAGYPLLKDTLQGCPIVWDGTQSIGPDNNSAIEIINNWVNETMEFTSEDERPHQPVRIYRKHIGRCGEHADLTAAVARAGLIPCASIFSYSGDHTWNEFWDQEWIMWEPVNNFVDRPLVYENSWGWTFATVFDIRSDGYLTPVTERYSEGTATIIVYALDNNGGPIDGAEVRLYVRDLDYPILIRNDFYGLSDNEGKCVFTVGEARDYFARIDTEIGSYPEESSQVVEIISNAQNGQVYSRSLSVTGTMPALSWTEIDTPLAENTHYKVVVDFTVPEQLLAGDIWMDDVSSSSQHTNNVDDGMLDFFMTDETNFTNYTNNSSFDCFNLLPDMGMGQVTFYAPESGDWYCIFANDRRLNNPQHITGTIELYSDISSHIAGNEKLNLPNGYKLEQNYPNPFNPSTTIAYELEAPFKVTAEIINSRGQVVKKLISQKQNAGSYSLQWHGKNQQNYTVSSGVYFLKINFTSYESQSKTYSEFRKMILIR